MGDFQAGGRKRAASTRQFGGYAGRTLSREPNVEREGAKEGLERTIAGLFYRRSVVVGGGILTILLNKYVMIKVLTKYKSGTGSAGASSKGGARKSKSSGKCRFRIIMGDFRSSC